MDASQGVSEFRELKLTSKDHDGDAFDEDNGLWHLVKSHQRDQRKVWTSPRVGLVVKRWDKEKEKYWLSDYRYLSMPEQCKKEQILPQL